MGGVTAMHEIKFRGRDGDDWYYGSLFVNSVGQTAICAPKSWWMKPVKAETVGQFTGLKDHKDHEIYEGDIVKVVNDGEESFHVVKYMVDLDYPAFDLEPALDGDFNSLGYCLIDIDTKITVIGNIYDNPELLRLTKTGGLEK